MLHIKINYDISISSVGFYTFSFYLNFLSFFWKMCFPSSNSMSGKKPWLLCVEYRNNSFVMHVHSLFCLENIGFELDLGEISNLLCFASLKFHFLLARGICALNLSLYIAPFWKAYLWKRMSFNILFDQSGSLFWNMKKKVLLMLL